MGNDDVVKNIFSKKKIKQKCDKSRCLKRLKRRGTGPGGRAFN